MLADPIQTEFMEKGISRTPKTSVHLEETWSFSFPLFIGMHNIEHGHFQYLYTHTGFYQLLYYVL